MTTCTCPDNRQTIDSGDRVILIPPDAEVRQGNMVMRDPSKVVIYHKDCPLHGYSVVEDVDGVMNG